MSSNNRLYDTSWYIDIGFCFNSCITFAQTFLRLNASSTFCFQRSSGLILIKWSSTFVGIIISVCWLCWHHHHHCHSSRHRRRRHHHHHPNGRQSYRIIYDQIIRMLNYIKLYCIYIYIINYSIRLIRAQYTGIELNKILHIFIMILTLRVSLCLILPNSLSESVGQVYLLS